MSAKKVQIGTKPSTKSKPAPAPADAWVAAKADGNKMKRLTIDIPEGLHRAIKTKCAMRGVKIADELRELLLQKYGE
jgi:predicted DNA binding CopG/RHH family protein